MTTPTGTTASAAADGVGRQIAKHIEQAQTLRDDLAYMIDRGDKLADRLDAVVRHGRVRRAKLYYLRGRSGKSARIAERARDTTGTTTGAVPVAEAPAALPE